MNIINVVKHRIIIVHYCEMNMNMITAEWERAATHKGKLVEEGNETETALLEVIVV